MASRSDWTVLITGCSSGIGWALAQEFARRNHQVFASARRPELIAELAGVGIEPLALDVTVGESITAATSHVLERAGKIDMIVNNAGALLVGPVAELPLAEMRSQFEVNTLGPVALAQAVIPHMAKRGSGRIVNVGSISGIFATPFGGVYSGSKAALHRITETLRVEVAPLGIEVVLVQPGAVRSQIGDKAGFDPERYRRQGSLYRSVVAGIEKRAYMTQGRPMAAEDFARKVVKAVTRPRPPRVLRVGNGSSLFPAIRRLLPDAVIDRLVSRRFGLTELEH